MVVPIVPSIGRYPAVVPQDTPVGPVVEPAVEPAIVDLLGALAYAELSAFDRLADDARMAPTLDGRAHMSAMAAVEMTHYSRLAERLTESGVAPAARWSRSSRRSRPITR